MDRINHLFELAARLDRLGIILTRVGLIVVLVWIGGLKVYAYEDEGIVPFVANSPLMNFFYHAPVGEYRQHMNREGELVTANREWHQHNGTYLFAYGLGSAIVAFGVMIALHPWLPRVAAVGSFLVFLMSFVTLSFLVTTPETWVQPLGSPEHGFPLLSGAGRLETLTKIPLQDGAADPGQLQEVERAVDRRQLVIADLQPAGLPDPGEAALHHVADLAQSAAVRRPLPRQVVFDAAPLEALLVARRAVGPVPVQRLGLAPRPAAPAFDRRDVVHQGHSPQRLVAVRAGQADGQRGALAIDEQVALGALFPAIRGVLAGEYP